MARIGRVRYVDVMFALVALAGAVLLAGCSRSSAYTLNRDGNSAYTRGDTDTALNDYRRAQVARPDLPVFGYNAGNTLYQQGDYTRAAAESQQAAQTADGDLRAHALYSVGADDYRQGKLQDALDAFKSALRIDPSDQDTKYNVELIQRQLDKEAQSRPPQGQQPQQTPQPQQGQQQNGQPPPAGGQQGSGQQPQNGQPPPNGGNPQQGQGGNGQQPGGQQQGQAGQGQPGQGQPGQGQPGQSGQSGTQQPGQPGAPAQGGANGQPTNIAPAAGGTPAPSPRQQAAQADQALQRAVQQYGQQPSIDDALKILDALAEQERAAQQAQANQFDPHSQDK